jgi:hypothetical protein
MKKNSPALLSNKFLLLIFCLAGACLPIKAQTKVYATHSSSGSSGKTTIVVTVQEGKVTNEANATGTAAGSASLNVYSTSSALYDANAWLQLKFINDSEQLPAGTPVYIKYTSATVNILNLLLSSSTSVKAYKNATSVANGTEAAATITGVTISGSNYIKITPSECFNSVRITLVTSSLLLGAAAIDVDEAYFECPGTPVAQTPAAVCSGATGSLAVSSPVSCLSYNWYASASGGAALYNGTSISTAALGSNTTYYLGSSLIGCTDRNPVTIAVNSLPANPSSTNKNICMGNSTQLKVNAPDNAVSYKWYSNTSDTSLIGTDTIYITQVLRSSRAYYVRAQHKSTGCLSSSKTAVSAIVPSPANTFGNNGDSVTCPVKGTAYVDFLEPVTGRLLASINPNGQDLGNVTTRLFKAISPVNVQPCGTSSLNEITAALNRHWKIEPAVQPTASVDIRLYFSQAEFDSLQKKANMNANANDDINAESDIILTKYHSSNATSSLLNCDGQGVTKTFNNANHGSASDIIAGFSAAGRYVHFSIPGFSEMWLHGAANMVPLPIELLSFKVKCSNNEAAISWVTSMEINNKEFSIQRSIDGEFWTTVGFVPGVGNSTEEHAYIYTDTRPLQGTSYYRLEQKDIDGTTATFNAAPLDCSTAPLANNLKLAIYPNPASDDFNIKLQSEDRIDGTAEIFNAIGDVMYSMPVHVPAGGNSIVIKNTLDVGAYFVRVLNANNNQNSIGKLYVSR